METYAKVICDSVSPLGVRLTSIESQFPRFILPQILMHRQWSRSCESLRARPTRSKLEEVRQSPFVPLFRKNQKGMVAGELVDYEEANQAGFQWGEAWAQAVRSVTKLMELGVAKEIANRLLEPFAFQKMLVTATDFENFFRLRCADDAQPEIQEVACKMKEAMGGSVPVERREGEWHLPYVTDSKTGSDMQDIDWRKVSAARCARVSYVTHDGVKDTTKDLTLAETLIQQGHSNPFEHQATVGFCRDRYANFRGWVSYRFQLEQQSILPKQEAV